MSLFCVDYIIQNPVQSIGPQLEEDFGACHQSGPDCGQQSCQFIYADRTGRDRELSNWS